MHINYNYTLPEALAIVASTQRRLKLTPIKTAFGLDCNMVDRALVDSKLTELNISLDGWSKVQHETATVDSCYKSPAQRSIASQETRSRERMVIWKIKFNLIDYRL